MSMIINIKLTEFEVQEVALAYGFYYGSYLTTDNAYLKKVHGQIVEYMDKELAKLIGTTELVEMKAEIIADLENKQLLSHNIVQKTKNRLQKNG